MKTKQQVVADFRRQEILAAARTVFARKGFAGGIVDEIAKEAGLAKGTVYLYFRSKRELFKAVLEHDMEALKADTLQRIDAATGLDGKIRAFALARLEHADANGELFRIMDTSGHSFTRKQYNALLKEPALRLTAEIEAAQGRGEIRSLPAEKVAWTIVDLTRGSVQRRLIGETGGTPAEEADFLLDLIWAGLGVAAQRS